MIPLPQSPPPTISKAGTQGDEKKAPLPWLTLAGDDWHLHLRDSELLPYSTRLSSGSFKRVLIMPNLTPPIIHVQDALAYRQRILVALENSMPEVALSATAALAQPLQKPFEPLMALYLQEKTSPAEVQHASAEKCILGYKYYPKGATTNAEYGVRSVDAVSPALAAMEKYDVPLMVHGESTNRMIDVFDREAYFIDHVLTLIRKRFPELRITLEHISTEKAVRYIESATPGLAGSITLHHLLLTRNDLLGDGLRPHFYCKPLVQRRQDREALLKVALSGSKRFFYGSDSAPHPLHMKESACGCAGIFSSPFALPILAELFALHQAWSHLEAFIAKNGAQHYQLPVHPPHTPKIALLPLAKEGKNYFIPQKFNFGQAGHFVPFGAGQKLAWKATIIT